MKITPKQYAQVLYDLVKDADQDQLSVLLGKFVSVLTKNNQVSQLDKIISYFSQIWNKEKGLTQAEIISANKLDEQITEQLKSFVMAKSNNKNVEIKQRIKKGIKGGFIIRFDDKIIDSSIKNKLNQLKNQII